jgi:DNA-binding transcriptional LysR family regulator
MDWRSAAFDWTAARAFLALAEEGSLSAAGRALGLSQPTIGRQVAALEAGLGIALVERAGRGLVLTPGGAALVDHLRAMGQAAARVGLAAAGRSQVIEGLIRITASEVYCAFLLPPLIARLRAAHPGIEVEIIAANQPTDLLRREADIAIRNFASTQPEVIARRLRDDAARPYATPEVIAALGHPRRMADLAGATFLGFANTEVLIDGLRGLGAAVTRRNFPVVTDSHLVQWAFVRQGAGIGLITEAAGDAEPAVRRVLPEAPPITFPMWLATHRDLHTSRRVRTVFDLLAAELSARGR